MTCSLVVMRLTLGFPTTEWFRTTLVHLPLYHSDSTGIPLPLYWKGVGFGALTDKLIGMILIPGMPLPAFGLYAFTLQKAIERRLPLYIVRARFYTLVLIYSLFSLKTIMDRSHPIQIVNGSAMLLMLVLLDGLGFLERWFWRPRSCLRSWPPVWPPWRLSRRSGLIFCHLSAAPFGQSSRSCRASLRSTNTPDEMIALNLGPSGWRRLAWG